MRYLCLIHLDEQAMAELPHAEINDLNVRHLALNEELRSRGKLIEVVDGPFTETKELVAGFYLIDAADLHEAIEIASRFPSAPLARIEVWPTRELEVYAPPG